MYFQFDNSAHLPKFFKDHERVDISKATSYYNLWACLYKGSPKCILVTKWDDKYIYGIDLSKIKLQEIDALLYEILKNIDESEFDIFPEGIDKKTGPLIENFAVKVRTKWKRKSFDTALYISPIEAFNLAALMKQ